MTADHRVTWDHTYCEHTLDDDEEYNACAPDGTITCEAVGPGVSYCRWTCDPGVDSSGRCDEGWSLCSTKDDHLAPGEPAPDPDDDDQKHLDPGVPHCIYGHPMVLTDCNAVLGFDGSSVEECYDDQPLTDFHDGPVNVAYEGDGVYVWSYA